MSRDKNGDLTEDLMRSSELSELCRKAACSDPQQGDGAAVTEALLELSAAESALAAAKARLLERAEREEVTVEAVGLKPGLWLARNGRLPRKKCKAAVGQASLAVGTFEAMVSAAGEAELTWAHVEYLCRASNSRNRSALASVQSELIEAAQEMSFELWTRLVDKAAEEADEDGGYDPNGDVHANRLRLSPLPDMTREVKGRLVGEAAITVESTLEQIADELFRRFTRDAEVDPTFEVPDRKTLMALALAEVCRRATAVDLDSTKPARPEAVVVVDRDEDGKAMAHDIQGRPVSAAALETLLGDASFRALITDADRVPLELGHSVRLFTQHQKMALAVRDGGCVFPGCDMPPAWCDGHHVVAVGDGGTTDISNGALLCRQHHGITHRNGWKMFVLDNPPSGTAAQGSLFEWVTPGGNTIYSQHRPPGRPPRESVAA